jgi:tRNA G18 (ribose-2'-O)-methylase SpoU
MSLSIRTETRQERHDKKANKAVSLPFDFAASYFNNDGNVAFLSRSLACFGGRTMHIIGRMPNSHELSRLSGTASRLVKWETYKNPFEFIEKTINSGYKLVCAEMTDNAVSSEEYNWDFNAKTIIILGNETEGVPYEIIKYSDVVYIPMIGKAWNLNTAMAGNVLAYNYAMKYMAQERNKGNK